VRNPVFSALLSGVPWVLLAGWGTPTNLQADQKGIDQILGIEHPEVRFMSHCYFAEIRKLEKKTVQYSQGILALTGTKLHLLGGDLQAAATTEKIEVAISDVDGVDLREFTSDGGMQLQLLYGEYLLVIVVTSENAWVDREGSQKLHDLLISDGVTQWQSEGIYKEDGPFFIVPMPGQK
jgi:hypothetical protein